MSHGDDDVVYFNNACSIFDPATSTFEHLVPPETFFTATYMQAAFSYQICGGNVTRFPVRYASSSSFHTQCRLGQAKYDNG